MSIKRPLAQIVDTVTIRIYEDVKKFDDAGKAISIRRFCHSLSDKHVSLKTVLMLCRWLRAEQTRHEHCRSRRCRSSPRRRQPRRVSTAAACHHRDRRRSCGRHRISVGGVSIDEHFDSERNKNFETIATECGRIPIDVQTDQTTSLFTIIPRIRQARILKFERRSSKDGVSICASSACVMFETGRHGRAPGSWVPYARRKP